MIEAPVDSTNCKIGEIRERRGKRRYRKDRKLRKNEAGTVKKEVETYVYHSILVRDLPSSFLRVIVDPHDSLSKRGRVVESAQTSLHSTEQERDTYMIIGSIRIATTSSFGRVVGFLNGSSSTFEHGVEFGSNTLSGGSRSGFTAIEDDVSVER